jgi:hypothetical protein
MTDTAKQLVDRIVECKDQLCAVDIIKEVINNLKVSRNYQRMVEVEKGIRELESAFKELQEEFHVMALPRQYTVVQETRTKANFIYRELVDNYVHEVNRVKMLLEESKTVERAKALEYLKNDANYSNIAKSTMRDYLGASPNYEEWIRDYSMAYANYQYLSKVLESVRIFTDTCASELRGLGVVEKTDVK